MSLSAEPLPPAKAGCSTHVAHVATTMMARAVVVFRLNDTFIMSITHCQETATKIPVPSGGTTPVSVTNALDMISKLSAVV